MDGVFRGTADRIGKYETLSVCVEILAFYRRLFSTGGHGLEAEVGCEGVYDVIEKHIANVKEIMRDARYGKAELKAIKAEDLNSQGGKIGPKALGDPEGRKV